MALIVQKFGGTSIANVDRIKKVARRIAAEVQAGHQVAVVVSAMAGVTNQLIDWVNQSSGAIPDSSEYDTVVSTGEQVTCGLLALALQEIGIPARSWLAWQLKILTNNTHQHAQIHSIYPDEILESMGTGTVAVIAGFQGIDAQNRITTLGRGGSDTTAVALAHALQADRCDIYTDVDGVFTADPQVVPTAKKLDEISYESMLALAQHGARVLQPDSVELAMSRDLTLQVRSSFSQASGTIVVHKPTDQKQKAVTGVACDDQASLFSIEHSKDFANKLQSAFLEEGIPMVLTAPGPHQEHLMLIPRTYYEKARLLAQDLGAETECTLTTQEKVSTIATVGPGIESIKKQISNLTDGIVSDSNATLYGSFVTPHKYVSIVDEEISAPLLQLLHDQFCVEKPIPFKRKTA